MMSHSFNFPYLPGIHCANPLSYTLILHDVRAVLAKRLHCGNGAASNHLIERPAKYQLRVAALRPVRAEERLQIEFRTGR